MLREMMDSRFPLILVVFLASFSCAEDNLMIVDGAYDVKSIQMSENMYHLSYRVDIQYPELAIGKEINDKITKMGWTYCSENNAGWKKYVDSVNPKISRCIHRYGFSYYMRDQLKQITMTYESDTNNENACQISPETSQQTVIISIYSNVDVRSEIERLGLNCERSMRSE